MRQTCNDCETETATESRRTQYRAQQWDRSERERRRRRGQAKQ